MQQKQSFKTKNTDIPALRFVGKVRLSTAVQKAAGKEHTKKTRIFSPFKLKLSLHIWSHTNIFNVLLCTWANSWQERISSFRKPIQYQKFGVCATGAKKSNLYAIKRLFFGDSSSHRTTLKPTKWKSRNFVWEPPSASCFGFWHIRLTIPAPTT